MTSSEGRAAYAAREATHRGWRARTLRFENRLDRRIQDVKQRRTESTELRMSQQKGKDLHALYVVVRDLITANQDDDTAFDEAWERLADTYDDIRYRYNNFEKKSD